MILDLKGKFGELSIDMFFSLFDEVIIKDVIVLFEVMEVFLVFGYSDREIKCVEK